jgi:hypothetical protein
MIWNLCPRTVANNDLHRNLLRAWQGAIWTGRSTEAAPAGRIKRRVACKSLVLFLRTPPNLFQLVRSNKLSERSNGCCSKRLPLLYRRNCATQPHQVVIASSNPYTPALCIVFIHYASLHYWPVINTSRYIGLMTFACKPARLNRVQPPFQFSLRCYLTPYLSDHTTASNMYGWAVAITEKFL